MFAPARLTAAKTPPHRRGFSLLELLVVMALLVAIVAIAVPAYRGYVATARDGALLQRLLALRVFQEDVRLRTGSYGSGRYDAAAGVATLSTAIGWEPSGDEDVVYTVTANGGTSWTGTVRDAGGQALCRVFPDNRPCGS